RDQWRQRDHRPDDAGAEQRAFQRTGGGLAYRPETGFAEQRADAVQAQARAFEAAGEQVEAAAHEATAGQRYGDTGDRTGDGRRDDAAPAPRLASTARPEPQAEADRGAEQQAFRATGDVARRTPEQQVEGIEAEQLDHGADQHAAERAAGDRPAPARARQQRRSADPEADAGAARDRGDDGQAHHHQ